MIKLVHIQRSVGVIFAAWSACTHASNLIHELSYNDEAAALEITFSCPIRYLSHNLQTIEKTLRIELLPLSACRQLMINSSTVPSLSNAGETLIGVQWTAKGGEVELQLKFTENATFLVSQGSDIQKISVTNRRGIASTSQIITNQPALNDDEVAVLIQQAREQLLDEHYQRAIDIYTRLLENSNDASHSQALEYLGLAYQMSGRPKLAAKRYATWLQRYTDKDDQQRVQQRLDALMALGKKLPSSTISDAKSSWNLFGSVSQDLWHQTVDTEFADTKLDALNRTALVTYVDMGAAYQGDDLNVRAYVSTGYQNMLGTTKNDTQGDLFARRAYVELSQPTTGMQLRVGRQSSYHDGIMGLFDGARGSWSAFEGVRFNVTAGLSVDNPRYAASPERQFVGLSTDIDDIVHTLDANFYTHLQKTDGIWDRQAIGTRWLWQGDWWHSIALLDYDVSYNVVNNALLNVTARLSEHWRVQGRLQAYANPFIGTSNALIGQPVATIEQLLQTYTDAQLRTLARDRSRDERHVSIGLNGTLSPNWSVQLDTSYTDIASTVSSANVVLQPATIQISSSATLLGSSIVRSSDTLIFSYRLFSDYRADTHTARVDWRFPFADKFRLNPRLAISSRASQLQGDQLILAPGLRITYLWNRRYQLNLEVSGRWSDRKLPSIDPFSIGLNELTETNQELFFYLQWRADF